MNNYPWEGALFATKENRERLASERTLEQCRAHGTVLEARAVVFDRSRRLVVDLGCMRGVMPYEECALGLAEGTAHEIAVLSRVGKPVCFRVIGFGEENGARTALLSRRSVQATCRQEYLDRLRPGDVIGCTATRLEPFGVFCDVGRGISALLPLDYISVSRIRHPAQRIRAGMPLRCAVRAIDENGRLLLTQKELLGSWLENAARFAAGETVSGIVRSVEEYGVFVELAPNLAGLAEPCAAAREGLRATVYIKSLQPERMKIKLVLVDCFPADTPKLPPLEYFFQGDHLSRFLYSPPACRRRIETVFDPQAAGDVVY